LALWAAVYDVTPPPVLAGAISSDADFIGNVQLARKLGHALKLWDFWQPAPDDATTQTAKLTRTVANGIKQIDFLDGIAGLDTQAVQRRAATITLASGADQGRSATSSEALRGKRHPWLLYPKASVKPRRKCLSWKVIVRHYDGLGAGAYLFYSSPDRGSHRHKEDP